MEECGKKWNKSLSSEDDYRANRCSYKNVIANAFAMGPLCNRCLVVKKNMVQANIKERFDYLYELREGEAKPQKSTKQKFLKNIAAYLVLREYHPENQNTVLLRRGQLLGWYGQDDAKNDATIWFLPRFLWNGVSIFSRSNTYSNYIKLAINSEYLKEFDFKVICESLIDDYRDEYWILEDSGHGKPLSIEN